MKKRLVIFFILIALASSVQLGWLWPANLTTLTFSFGFVVITVMAFAQRWSYALWYSLAQGICIDLFSPFVFGTYTLASLILVICIGVLQDTWLKQHSLLSVATITATSLLLTQFVMLGVIALSEYTDIIITQSVMEVSIVNFVLGVATMIFCTLIGVRVLNRQYVKLI